VLLVALGGVVGALARYGAGLALPHEPGSWAWSTLVVNALGAALLCALLSRVADLRVRLLLGTGLLGAFTTFSGLTVDAVLLAQERPALAVAYLAVGVLTLLAGGLLGRAVAAP
jgi:CrcB protein